MIIWNERLEVAKGSSGRAFRPLTLALSHGGERGMVCAPGHTPLASLAPLSQSERGRPLHAPLDSGFRRNDVGFRGNDDTGMTKKDR